MSARPSHVDHRKRALRVLSLTAGLAIAAFAPVLWWLELHGIAVMVVGLSGLFLTVLVVLSATESLRVATHYFGAVALVGFGALSMVAGGTTSPVFATFLIIPVSAVFLLGRNAALLWTVMGAAALVLILSLDAGFDVLPPFELPRGQYAVLVAAINLTVLGVMLYFAYQISRVDRQRVVRLEGANVELRNMTDQLAQASARLTSAADRLVAEGVLEDLEAKAGSGRQTIALARSGMTQIMGEYERVAAMVAELDEHMRRIVELVELIDQLNRRLDIMALNVGLEAAHVGEAGRQFEVLAEDLRRLAGSVLADAREIKTLLLSLGEKASFARDASERGLEYAAVGNARIDDMATSFDQVCELLESAASAAGDLTRAALEEIEAIEPLVGAAAEKLADA